MNENVLKRYSGFSPEERLFHIGNDIQDNTKLYLESEFDKGNIVEVDKFLNGGYKEELLMAKGGVELINQLRDQAVRIKKDNVSDNIVMKYEMKYGRDYEKMLQIADTEIKDKSIKEEVLQQLRSKKTIWENQNQEQQRQEYSVIQNEIFTNPPRNNKEFINYKNKILRSGLDPAKGPYDKDSLLIKTRQLFEQTIKGAPKPDSDWSYISNMKRRVIAAKERNDADELKRIQSEVTVNEGIKLFGNDADELRKMTISDVTLEDKAVNRAEKVVENTIRKGNLISGFEPVSVMQADKAIKELNRQLQEGAKEKKNVIDMLDDTSPDYIVDKVIREFRVIPMIEPKRKHKEGESIDDYNKRMRGRQAHPLVGYKAGRYKVNGKEVKWDGSKEIR